MDLGYNNYLQKKKKSDESMEDDNLGIILHRQKVKNVSGGGEGRRTFIFKPKNMKLCFFLSKNTTYNSKVISGI